MDKEFSKDFIDDIMDLLRICNENDTDNVGFKIPFNKSDLLVKISFDVVSKE